MKLTITIQLEDNDKSNVQNFKEKYFKTLKTNLEDQRKHSLLKEPTTDET